MVPYAHYRTHRKAEVCGGLPEAALPRTDHTDRRLRVAAITKQQEQPYLAPWKNLLTDA